MKTLILLSSLLMAIATADRLFAAAPEGQKPYHAPPALVAGNNRFALDFYRRWSQSAEGSLICSPYSISTALAMVFAGAHRQTAEEMAKTLHFTLPSDELHTANAALLKQLTAAAPDRGYQIRIANRLWVQQGYTLLPPFLKTTQDDYGAEAASADFAQQPEAARATINSWVEKQTKNRIKDLVPAGGLSSDTRLVLANAIYFKGDWRWAFGKESTHKGQFSLTATKTADAEMMYQTREFRYFQRDDLQILEMPYKSGDLAMDFLLPAKVDGLAALEKSLASEKLEKWIAGLHDAEVIVSLPKFKMTAEIDLGSHLAAMGMPLAFSPQGADFSGMNGKTDLFLSKALHKAFVEVDETGTEAAAATEVDLAESAKPGAASQETFLADHPFLFLIRDTRSGSILFIGRYTGPS